MIETREGFNKLISWVVDHGLVAAPNESEQARVVLRVRGVSVVRSNSESVDAGPFQCVAIYNGGSYAIAPWVVNEILAEQDKNQRPPADSEIFRLGTELTASRVRVQTLEKQNLELVQEATDLRKTIAEQQGELSRVQELCGARLQIIGKHQATIAGQKETISQLTGQAKLADEYRRQVGELSGKLQEWSTLEAYVQANIPGNVGVHYAKIAVGELRRLNARSEGLNQALREQRERHLEEWKNQRGQIEALREQLRAATATILEPPKHPDGVPEVGSKWFLSFRSPATIVRIFAVETTNEGTTIQYFEPFGDGPRKISWKDWQAAEPTPTVQGSKYWVKG